MPPYDTEKAKTKKETVRLLREGWYGTLDKFPEGDLHRKAQVNCKALWERSLNLATTKFVPICHGIKGTIGSLEIDETYVHESVNVPIDTLINDLSNGPNLDNDNGADVEQRGI